MYTNTDILVLLVIIIAITRGWQKGLFRSLITPFSFAISYLIASIYFDLSRNLFKSLLVMLGSAVALTVVNYGLLLIARRTVSEQDRSYVFIGSRVLGTVVNFCWQTAVAGFTVFLLSSMPDSIFGSENVKKDITRSTAYQYVEYYTINSTPVLYNIKETIEVLGTPEKMVNLESNTDYQMFVLNPKVQALLNDETVMKQMKDKNILQLIDNPKIRAVFGDDDLMKKFTEIGHRIYKSKAKETERLQEEMEKALEQ